MSVAEVSQALKKAGCRNDKTAFALNGFDTFQENFSIVGESRGLGAMRALELVSDKKTKEPLPAESVKKIVHECENRGLLIIKAGIFDNVLRTLMPLTIQEKELNKGLDILESVLKDFSKGNPIK